MADDEAPPVEEGTEDLLDEAETIGEVSESVTDRMHRENQLVGRASDYIARWSENGEISNANANALADALSDELAHYTKTDIKQEFTQVFVDDGGADGIPFDELIEKRLEEVKVVSTTDAKQGLVWRWHFSDGVQLETEKSKDEGRKHYDWPAWKEDYFEALISLGKGERIAPPSPDRRDPADWKDWLSDLLLDHAEIVEHVGPRTEAVEMLRDYINRQTAYADVKDMRDRQGIWMDAPPTDDTGQAATDGGGPTEIRIPTQAVKRICDQAGIETRALQIELDARGQTRPDISGVSDSEHVEGQRVSFWSLDSNFAEPAEYVEDPESPAEQVAQEQEAAAEDARTDVGAVDGDESSSDGDSQDPDSEDSQPDEEEESSQPEEESDSDEPQTASENNSDPPHSSTDEEANTEFGPGITGGFGTDPDEQNDGGE